MVAPWWHTDAYVPNELGRRLCSGPWSRPVQVVIGSRSGHTVSVVTSRRSDDEIGHTSGAIFKVADGCLVVCAIDNHWDFDLNRRTSAGELIYQSKYAGFDGGSRNAAEELGRQLGEVVARLREMNSRLVRPLRELDAICAVPFFENKDLSVPHVLAAHLAGALQVEDLSRHVRKTRFTAPSKNTDVLSIDSTPFETDPEVSGQRIALVDDVVRNGSTLASLALALRRDGASSAAVGLCATRAVASSSRDVEY
jgi:glutamine phosphoribosylpyrophosphate amidotransferase